MKVITNVLKSETVKTNILQNRTLGMNGFDELYLPPFGPFLSYNGSNIDFVISARWIQQYYHLIGTYKQIDFVSRPA